MSADQILSLFERAQFFSQLIKAKKDIPQILKNRVIANLFFENSTRTKFSFEIAAKRLGGNILNFNTQSSSVSKGESLYDTIKTFESLGVEIGIIRHSDDSYIESMKDLFNFSVVNAGAGKFEHPSQSILDLYTIYQEFGELNGKTITICGDIRTSRVASSNISAFKMFNCKVNFCGPEGLMPNEIPEHCEVKDIDEALAESDVAMFLRVQHERHTTAEVNTQTYNEKYGLNDERLVLLKPECIIMHPGPVNRDVEILSHLVEHEKSRIFKQMENGVYTRMAILEWIVS